MPSRTRPAKAASPVGAAAATPARRPGRPAGQASSAGGREPLLQAALQLFSRRGIADTPLSAVAAAAGVSKAMVHYHFTSREQLLDAVVREKLLPLRRQLMEKLQLHSDPVQGLTDFAGELVAQAAAYDWLAPLWIREVLSDGGLLRDRIRAVIEAEGGNATAKPIALWQAQGKLNSELDPEQLMLSILGLTLLPMAAFNSGMLSAKRARPELVARHAVALLTAGIRPE